MPSFSFNSRHFEYYLIGILLISNSSELETLPKLPYNLWRIFSLICIPTILNSFEPIIVYLDYYHYSFFLKWKLNIWFQQIVQFYLIILSCSIFYILINTYVNLQWNKLRLSLYLFLWFVIFYTFDMLIFYYDTTYFAQLYLFPSNKPKFICNYIECSSITVVFFAMYYPSSFWPLFSFISSFICINGYNHYKNYMTNNSKLTINSDMEMDQMLLTDISIMSDTNTNKKHKESICTTPFKIILSFLIIYCISYFIIITIPFNIKSDIITKHWIFTYILYHIVWSIMKTIANILAKKCDILRANENNIFYQKTKYISLQFSMELFFSLMYWNWFRFYIIYHYRYDSISW
eukprot:223293_1